MLAFCRPPPLRCGRAGIIMNGSPLLNGAAESGPSNIRKWPLENDPSRVGLGGDRHGLDRTGPVARGRPPPSLTNAKSTYSPDSVPSAASIVSLLDACDTNIAPIPALSRAAAPTSQRPAVVLAFIRSEEA
ncbi:hypothetical protein E1294_16985 [Nonomuraea diastatica]|uniref:Uncharacterized protein n=1 Tax=Nonomuraea diastatica TaxID=1848329 RepID=A0A4R4WT28_9ACTN|nr:hypothetical protein E1294_16985 [Nonomuraea diastatica]